MAWSHNARVLRFVPQPDLAPLGIAATILRTAAAGGALSAAGAAARPGWRAAFSGRVARLLAMGVAERVCYALTAVFFATLLQSTYGLSPAEVALPLAVFALGSIGGTVLGARLADRPSNRPLTFASAMFGSAALAVALFGWTGAGLSGSVAPGFGCVLVNAVARPSLMAALADAPDAVRGTVLGLDVTSASVGWLGAPARHGFAGFGPLDAGAAALGGALALAGRR